jgi:hypothetical protein
LFEGAHVIQRGEFVQNDAPIDAPLMCGFVKGKSIPQ